MKRRIAHVPWRTVPSAWLPWCSECGSLFEAPVITEEGPRCPVCVLREDKDRLDEEIRAFENFLKQAARSFSQEEFIETCLKIYNDAKE